MFKNIHNINKLDELVQRTLSRRPCGHYTHWYILIDHGAANIFDPITATWLKKAREHRKKLFELHCK